MINSEAIAGIPAVNLGQLMTPYQPFSIKTTTGGAGPGAPQNPQANGDVWGVVDISGRRGVLVKRGAVFTGRIQVGANQQILAGAAIYVASGSTLFTAVVSGSQVAVLLESFNNTGNPSAVTVNLKMLWI